MAALDAIQASTTAATTNVKTTDIVNKNDFFKLLIAQLKNQDPTKPLDATAFTAQLAQFSSLEQLGNVNSNLTTLLSQQGLLSKMQSSQLAGKYVVAGGDQTNAFTAQGKPVELGYELPQDASRVLITVFDQAGRAVDMFEKTNLSKGMNKATWSNGSARSGNFTFTVAAYDGQGQSFAAQTLTEGTVSSVNYRDGQVYVKVNNREVGIDQILSVTDGKQ
jgi:flagellar basal-body rod modification protein FlgD